ncbi:hypothetical protein FKM82_023329 [Ascaphus truei]
MPERPTTQRSMQTSSAFDRLMRRLQFCNISLYKSSKQYTVKGVPVPQYTHFLYTLFISMLFPLTNICTHTV